MVEQIIAFKTKHGTLFEAKSEADEVERLEDKDYFINEFMYICMDINKHVDAASLDRHQIAQVGELVYLYPSDFFELMKKYYLIFKWDKEWLSADNKEG